MNYNIKNNTLLIIPNNIKNKVLEYFRNKPLVNIKIMSLEELSKKYLFDYDKKALIYLMDKYNIKVDIAKKYLENIYYINECEYNSKKLNFLNDIKKELEEENILIYDNLFKMFLKSREEILVYGYDYINKFYMSILDDIKSLTNVIIFDQERIDKEKELIAYEFENIKDEVCYVAKSICKLVDSGVDINNIKLANVGDEYTWVINDVFKSYNIPIDLEDAPKILETNIGIEFINNANNKPFSEVIEILKNKINEQNQIEIDTLNKIISVCNKYDEQIITPSILSSIKSDLNNISVEKEQLLKMVEIIPLKDNIISDELYVFILGFNQGNIPIIYKDEDYITDNLKTNLALETTIEKNKLEKEIMSKIIKSIKNLVITYKLKTPFEEYYPSSMIDDLNMTVKRVDENYLLSYSKKNDKLNLAIMLDNLVKFNEVNPDLGVLYSNYFDIDYCTFDNSFKKISSEILEKHLDKLLLSYSSLDNFNRCQFRYYISNILKLEKKEETFATLLGSLFHYILSVCFNSDFNLDDEWNKYLNDLDLSEKERFFLSKLKDELIFIIDTIKMQEIYSELKNKLYEEKIYLNKDRNIKITFMGIVDKIVYEKFDNDVIVAIIDYKTGHPELNLNNTIYGIGMQLPVYIYLVKNKEEFKDAKIAGIYLQKILNNDSISALEEDNIEEKKKSLRLQGISNDSEEILKHFDTSYKDSQVIKSMKISSKGFYSYAKVISEEKLDKLTSLVDKNIESSIDSILSGDFKINPKRIGSTNVGCEFCHFKDLCYMSEKDIVNLKEYKNLEFLD